MTDPLAEVVTLLQPSATLSKVVSGAGRWRLRRTEVGQPFYAAVVEGACHLAAFGHAPILLRSGDVVLIPSACDFAVSSLEPPPATDRDVVPLPLPGGEFRLGDAGGPGDMLILVGHCTFGSPDAALLVSLLPQVVHVRGETRLATLVELVGGESRGSRPARDVVLARLLEVLLIEAFRSTTGSVASSGLLRGLADARLAVALRSMHEDLRHPWTVAELARQAAMSRSAFFERFRQAIGVTPMDYLLTWRMAVAKTLLRPGGSDIAAVADRVGYGSASAFSVAFARHVGAPPARYARRHAEA